MKGRVRAFQFLPYKEIKENFLQLVTIELKNHGVLAVSDLHEPRREQLQSCYHLFDQLDGHCLDSKNLVRSEELKAKVAVAALLELKDNILKEYSCLRPEGGYLNKGSVVFKSLDTTMGITELNPLDPATSNMLKVTLNDFRRCIAENKRKLEQQSKFMAELKKAIEPLSPEDVAVGDAAVYEVDLNTVHQELLTYHQQRQFSGNYRPTLFNRDAAEKREAREYRESISARA